MLQLDEVTNHCLPRYATRFPPITYLTSGMHERSSSNLKCNWYIHIQTCNNTPNICLRATNKRGGELIICDNVTDATKLYCSQIKIRGYLHWTLQGAFDFFLFLINFNFCVFTRKYVQISSLPVTFFRKWTFKRKKKKKK